MSKQDLATININYLKFIKNDKGSQITYAITHNEKRVNIKIKKCYLPFGIEKYKNKIILNLEIFPDGNNEHFNIFNLIKDLEHNMRELPNNEYCPKKLKADIGEREYSKILKKRENSYLVRTHVVKNLDIKKKLGGIEFPLQLSDLTKMFVDVTIELCILWVNETNYGITFHVKSIVVN